MILVALGGNLPSYHGSPRQTLEAALARFPRFGLNVTACSPWYETAPVPISEQPFFINGVACIETTKDAEATLAALHAIEAEFGRCRSLPNAARSLDLDLIDYHGEIRDEAPILPHPRLHERAFVLYPLHDIAPDWQHPVLGQGLTSLIAALPSDQEIHRLS
ncbi:MAG: 2-amino-4-hydroxy-6-hydroxymethyldihydropteridine diphosphokinase [Rhodospirillaceae bacterium]|nr:2-amino-4-hydroxy-6-hydroxymethyldihydropteridine diphosphokinase [Rhodospirillaceae bacterium]